MWVDEYMAFEGKANTFIVGILNENLTGEQKYKDMIIRLLSMRYESTKTMLQNMLEAPRDMRSGFIPAIPSCENLN